jgi:hypothetical protein
LLAALRRSACASNTNAGASCRQATRSSPAASARLAHDRQRGTGNIHRAEQQRFELATHLVGAEVLERSRIETADLIDQNVERTEPFYRGAKGSQGIVGIGDVELVVKRLTKYPIAAATLPEWRPVATT